VRRRRSLLLLAVPAVLLLGTVLPATSAGAQQPKDKALVRLAHFAENVAVGDIYVVFVDGRQKFDDVPYKTVSDYLPLAPGTYKIEVRPARAPSTAPAEAQLSLTVEAGRAYSVCVWGEGTTVSAMVLNDQLDRPPAGQAKVRAINAITGSDGQPIDLVGAGGAVIADGVAPASASDYVAVPAGTSGLSVKAAGTTLDTAGTTLKGGSVYSVAVIGRAGRDDELLVIDDAAGAANAPAGGVATGGGGTAASRSPEDRQAAGWTIALVCTVAAISAIVWRRRRTV
jgi:hypothetical protein